MANDDLPAGLLLCAIGMLFLWKALALPLGTSTWIGPGYWPSVVATLLTAGGATLAWRGRCGFRLANLDLGPWRRPVAMIAALLLFAVLLRPFGLVVAAPATIVAASLAFSRTGLGGILALAAVVTVASILLFSLILRLPVPVLGTLS